MKLRPLLTLPLAWLTVAACSDDPSSPDTSETDTADTVVDTTDTSIPDSTTDTDTSVPDTDATDSTPTDTDTTEETIQEIIQEDVIQPEECEHELNVAKRQAIIASQPFIAVRSKSSKTATTTFASVAGNPAERCAVTILYKDNNGNDELDPYEDWTLTPAERAADLVATMSQAQKVGLLVHPTLTDAPTTANPNVSTATQGLLDNHVRFGKAVMLNATATNRARWANNLQAAAEASPLGVPFVLSIDPAHSAGNNRFKAAPFSRWPHELGLAATGDPNIAKTFGQVVSQEYRALGIRMALGVSANLATEPRWFDGQFGFGQDKTKVANMLGAYLEGLQGQTLGKTSVAAVVGHFPGAGPAKGGFDGRLAKGKYLNYRGNRFDDHVAPFQRGIERGAAAVMMAHGVSETGSWTGLTGVVSGQTLEQVGASFSETLIQDALRDHLGFGGLVLAPPGVLDDQGGTALGGPWGHESKSVAQRAAAALNAGVEQFVGFSNVTALTAALTANDVSIETVDRAAEKVLSLVFRLGLFEDPYIDEAQAPALVNTDPSYRAGLNAMNRSMVLIVNKDKPEGWLNGQGDGTQTEDKGNAGNGTMKVLPAPPGEPYVAAGCAYFVMGNFDLDYVRSVSAGYGELTNDATSIDDVPVSTAAERIARSDYVFIRIDAPYSYDPDSGSLGHGKSSLEYAGADNADALAPLIQARNAINALASSKTQIVVAIDSGRASVLSEVLAYNPSGVYLTWSVTDKVLLDVAFGIVNGVGKLPVGLPLSNAAANTQLEDVPNDGQHPTFVEGHGFSTPSF